MKTAEKITRLNGTGKRLAELKLDGDGNQRETLPNITPADVERALSEPVGTYNLNKLAALISPIAEDYLERMAQLAHQ
jgi:hypothetical protein